MSSETSDDPGFDPDRTAAERVFLIYPKSGIEDKDRLDWWQDLFGVVQEGSAVVVPKSDYNTFLTVFRDMTTSQQRPDDFTPTLPELTEPDPETLSRHLEEAKFAVLRFRGEETAQAFLIHGRRGGMGGVPLYEFWQYEERDGEPGWRNGARDSYQLETGLTGERQSLKIMPSPEDAILRVAEVNDTSSLADTLVEAL